MTITTTKLTTENEEYLKFIDLLGHENFNFESSTIDDLIRVKDDKEQVKLTANFNKLKTIARNLDTVIEHYQHEITNNNKKTIVSLLEDETLKLSVLNDLLKDNNELLVKLGLAKTNVKKNRLQKVTYIEIRIPNETHGTVYKVNPKLNKKLNNSFEGMEANKVDNILSENGSQASSTARSQEKDEFLKKYQVGDCYTKYLKK